MRAPASRHARRSSGGGRHLRGVDDGGKLADAVHAQVGDGEGAACKLLRLQLALLGLGVCKGEGEGRVVCVCVGGGGGPGRAVWLWGCATSRAAALHMAAETDTAAAGAGQAPMPRTLQHAPARPAAHPACKLLDLGRDGGQALLVGVLYDGHHQAHGGLQVTPSGEQQRSRT